MGRHSERGAKHDEQGRTRTGRARDRARGRDEDHGSPTDVSGSRADRRAGRTQVVTTNIFGQTKVARSGSTGKLKDRWS